MPSRYTVYHVFLSHAGEQKRGLVDYLHSFLVRIHPTIRVFLDEHSLQPGTVAWSAIETAAEHASIAVVVLSKEFVCKKAPMAELEIFLRRCAAAKAGGKQFVLLPVFWELSVEECQNLLEAVYHHWPSEDIPKPSTEVLAGWAAQAKHLTEHTGVRNDQARGFSGIMAETVTDAVVEQLKLLKLLPPDYTSNREVPWHKKSPTLLPPVHGLVGRQDQLEAVLRGVQGPDRAAVVVGGPGEGKSALASCAALQLLEQGWCDRGAWVVDFAGYGKDPAAAFQNFVAARRQQEMRDGQGLGQASQHATWEQVLEWLSQAALGCVLLVLENTEEVLSSEESSAALLQMLHTIQRLPARDDAACVRMIVCSRQALEGGLAGAEQVRLGPLPEGAAEELLQLHSGKGVAWEEGQAGRLVEICGGNALAISIIGGFIAGGRCTPKDIIEDHSATGSLAELGKLSVSTSLPAHLQQGRVHLEWLQRYLPPAEVDAVATLSVFPGSFSVQAAMAVGVQPDLRQAAGRWSGLLAGLWSKPTPAPQGSIAEGEAGVRALLRRLAAGSVVQAATPADMRQGSASAARFRLHPLIRVLGSKLLDARGDQLRLLMLQWMLVAEQGPGQLLLQQAGSQVQLPSRHRPLVRASFLHPLPTGSVSSSSSRPHCTPQADIITEDYNNLVEAARLLDVWCGWPALLSRCEQVWTDGAPLWPEEQQLVDAALAVAEVFVGSGLVPLAEHFLQPAAAAAMGRLGCSVSGSNNSTTSTATTSTAAASHGSSRSWDRLVVLMLLHSKCLMLMGHFSEVLKLEGQLLEAATRVLGRTHPTTIEALVALGSTHRTQGNLVTALELDRQVHALQAEVLGDSHPLTLSDELHLAASSGDHAGALEICERMIQACHAQHGASHQRTLDAMAFKGDIYCFMGCFEEALELQQRLEQLCRDALGPSHPQALRARANVAMTLCAKGDPDSACRILQLVHDDAVVALGSAHPLVVHVSQAVAVLYRRQGQHGHAQQLQHQAQQSWMQKLMLPAALLSLERLKQQATNCMMEGDLEGALTLAKQVVDKCQQAHGADHPALVVCMITLARVYRLQGNIRSALDVMQKVQDGFHRRHYADSSSCWQDTNFLQAQSETAMLQRLAGDFACAVQLEERVLSSWQEIVSQQRTFHTGALAAKSRLAITLRRQGRPGEALVLEQQVLEASMAACGGHAASPPCVATRWELATSMRDLGRLEEAVALEQQLLQLSMQLNGPADPNTIGCMARLAVTQRLCGRHEAAASKEQQVLEACSRLTKHDKHLAALSGVAHMAVMQWQAGDVGAAKVMEAQLLKAAELELGSEHPSTVKLRRNLGGGMSTTSYLPGAMPLYLHELLAVTQPQAEAAGAAAAASDAATQPQADQAGGASNAAALAMDHLSLGPSVAQ